LLNRIDTSTRFYDRFNTKSQHQQSDHQTNYNSYNPENTESNYWESLTTSLESRCVDYRKDIALITDYITNHFSKSNRGETLASCIQSLHTQDTVLFSLRDRIRTLRDQTDRLRGVYYGKGGRKEEGRSLGDISMVQCVPEQSVPGAQVGGFGQSMAGGGMFGQSTAQPVGGMFGAKPAVGMFGQSAAQPAGNMFGAAAQPAGGMFGAKPAVGMFGAAAQPAGSMFGQAPQTAGGMFGAAAPAQPTGGLFGQAPQTTGAFGQAPQTASAFGQATPPATGNITFGSYV
jgi:hypothetical protein